MLPLALVRARSRGNELVPRWVNPSDPDLRVLAAEILGRFVEAAAQRRTLGALDEEIAELGPLVQDRKLLDGLAKLCADKVASAPDPQLDPVALRAEVFALARERGPIAFEPGPLGRVVAADILSEVAVRRAIEPSHLEASLYADLREAHQILSFDAPTVPWLLDRYNVALAQGLLLAATQVQIRLPNPSPARIRQFLRQARFHQLIHRAQTEGSDLLVELDGPVSLFQQSTRYGFQLAAFLPTLLLHDGPWSLEADLVWTPRRLQRRFLLGPAVGLVSHARDAGGHQTREELWFQERFAQTVTDWSLETGILPIDLAGRGFVVPDFTLRKGGRVAHLEILGFWKRESLANRLELLRRYGPGNVILAVSRKLCAEGTGVAEGGVELVPFSAVVPVKDVIAAAERVAC